MHGHHPSLSGAVWKPQAFLNAATMPDVCLTLICDVGTISSLVLTLSEGASETSVPGAFMYIHIIYIYIYVYMYMPKSWLRRVSPPVLESDVSSYYYSAGSWEPALS